MKTKTQQTVADRIAHLSACGEAIEWASKYKSPAKAWKECHRGDWMLWLIGKCSGRPESDCRKKLVLCACECARLTLPIYEKRYPSGDCIRNCIETAERWARGEANIEELRKARAAASAAAYAASAAAYAAYAAAYAAYAAYAAVRFQELAACADIVRKHFPKPPQIAARRKANVASRAN